MARRRIRSRARRGERDEERGDASAPPAVDLHHMRPDQAMARLGQALHTARVRGDAAVDVITGRGLGNASQEPVLRTRVEQWLAGPEGRRFGVLGVTRRARGGALRVQLATRRDGNG